MASKAKLFDAARQILAERSFSELQINKLLPNLHQQHLKEPKLLGEIIDTWNTLMSNASVTQTEAIDFDGLQPPLACAPKTALVSKLKMNMATILAEVEPDLLKFEPSKLWARHTRIQQLGLVNNQNEHWNILFHAPRGFYLQNWTELTKKIYYCEHKIVDLLYDKREKKEMITHPIVKSAAVVEAEFDHMRTRYLFALRSGYKALSHMYSVQTALDRPRLRDIVLASDTVFLSKFAPFCSLEDYSCFADLIKNHDIDEDDADVYDRLAELENLTHRN